MEITDSEKYLAGQVLQLREQIDALKAHVNELRVALGNALEHAIFNDVNTDRFYEMIVTALSKAPEQSLAEHDREIYSKVTAWLNANGVLDKHVEKLIRQLYKGE